MEHNPLSQRVIWLHSPAVLMAALILGGLLGFLTPVRMSAVYFLVEMTWLGFTLWFGGLVFGVLQFACVRK